MGSQNFRKCVFKLVEVILIDDIDAHFSRQSGQLTRARIRYHRDTQLKISVRHGARVLQNEAAALTM